MKDHYFYNDSNFLIQLKTERMQFYKQAKIELNNFENIGKIIEIIFAY